MQRCERRTGREGEVPELVAWARWLRSIAACGRVGYAACAGFVAGAPGGLGHEVDDPESERVDEILADLKRLRRQAYAAVEQWYVWEASGREAAIRLGCSEKTFRVNRDLGEFYVLGRLQAEEEKC